MPRAHTARQAASATPQTASRCPAAAGRAAQAAALGVSEAVVLHHLDYWLGRSKHRFGGRAWVYNTYDAWHEQFFFLSMRTIQTTFRRLEHLGVVESSQALNRSRWDKTKWYSIDYRKLAELVPQTAAAKSSANDAPSELPSIAGQAAIDEAASVAIDGSESAPSWKTKGASSDYSNEILKRTGTSEPSEGAHAPALETTSPVVASGRYGEKVVNELDVAYEAIPEVERETWCERANRALEAAGMPEWMRITPIVKEMALTLWVGRCDMKSLQ